jgi:hypothetical protein
MILLLRAALGVLGLLYLAIGTGFLFAPVQLGETFGVAAAGAQGLASMRADFTGFFWVLGGSMAWSAWRTHGGALWAAAALIGIALAGRALSLLIDGSYPTALQPMAVEALSLVIVIVAARRFGKGN